MSSTDELRRLLDERGVEYELYARSCGASVWWRDSSGTMWRAHDNEEDELLSFYAYNSVTPAQAIAATLGDIDATGVRQRDAETCRNVYLVEESDELIEGWCPLVAYLSREAAEGHAELLRGEYDGIRQFARVVELKVVDE